MSSDFFITIYTDASLKNGMTQVAWRGKCSEGYIKGTYLVESPDIHHAEMLAIKMGIQDALNSFPRLQGFFVNCDNLGCVRAFWDFGGRKHGCPGPALELFHEIKSIVGKDRWIRTKHVKAHTGGSDVRSYMNALVDRDARIRT